MALENLEPATRIEEILNGGDITPATRLEYFLSAAANEVPKPEGASDAGKIPAVNSDGDGYALAEGLLLPVPDGSGDAGKIPVVNDAGDGYNLFTSGSGPLLTLPTEIATAVFNWMVTAAPTALAGGVGVPYWDTLSLTQYTGENAPFDAFIEAAGSSKNPGTLKFGSVFYTILSRSTDENNASATIYEAYYPMAGDIVASYALIIYLSRDNNTAEAERRYAASIVITPLYIPTPQN